MYFIYILYNSINEIKITHCNQSKCSGNKKNMKCFISCDILGGTFSILYCQCCMSDIQYQYCMFKILCEFLVIFH